MKNYIITFRSVTFAQKGERILKREGIDCLLRRTPKVLTSKECGYSLQVKPWEFAQALELLQVSGVQFGKAFGMDYNGRFEELAV